MNFNKKYIILGLAILVLCWTLNIAYYQNKVIKEPLFINHYYDIPKGMNSFDIYYIKDLSSQREITSVIFPELGTQSMNFTDTDVNSDKRYYMLKNIRIDILNGSDSDIPEEYKNKVITKAIIEFSDGKTMNVNLGKIYLFSDELLARAFKFYSASSSSDNTGSSNLIADKDLKVTGIDGRFNEEVKDILEIKVNNKLLSEVKFPLYLKKGEILYINYGFNFNENLIKQNNAYSFPLNVLTEDLSGNLGSTPCFFNMHMQSPKYFDIDALKNIGGEE
ncbi:hypothetical protein K9O30_07775 [Clostridium bowmanii]|uniref:hypothetical protein n=1 Tax=Clostridium bowmanii TaxID=132925 RepID=UPI001C0D1733|nr:hypothetical protein [Clostridium bowmanii]MBU3188962.1 hypothetical protein [Clostridium bowmanii]MCA1073627.1 hypothetical protein [Clostridium bowmanii]